VITFFGLPAILNYLSINAADDFQVEVYGPIGIRKYLNTMFSVIQHHLSIKLTIIELYNSNDKRQASETHNINDIDCATARKIFQDDKYTVYAGPLRHTVPCFGYVVQEADRNGNIDMVLATKLGLKEGPIMKEIKKGKPVTLPDGKIIRPEDIMSQPTKGRKVVILGDTCDSSGLLPVAMNSDLLVHECTLFKGDEPLAIQRGHSTAKMAGNFARQIKVAKLVISHFSQKATDSDIVDFKHDAYDAFGVNNVEAAEDFILFQLPLRNNKWRSL